MGKIDRVCISLLHLENSKNPNIMIFGGEPFSEKRHIWWNFVSTDKSMIDLAKKKWLARKFDPVFDETSYMDLPE